MFYKSLGDQPADTGIHVSFKRELRQADKLIASDTGPIVKLLNYEDVSDSQDVRYRTYDLWITFDPHETGWGAFHHFTLKLYTSHTSRKDLSDRFAEHADVIGLTYEGMEQ
jgi:hypothetical protein